MGKIKEILKKIWSWIKKAFAFCKKYIVIILGIISGIFAFQLAHEKSKAEKAEQKAQDAEAEAAKEKTKNEINHRMEEIERDENKKASENISDLINGKPASSIMQDLRTRAKNRNH